MLTAQHDIGALAGERQLILDKRLDIAEPSLDQVGRQDIEASGP